MARLGEQLIRLYKGHLPLRYRRRFGEFLLRTIVPLLMPLARNRIRTGTYTMFLSPEDLRGAWHFLAYHVRGSANVEPFEFSLILDCVIKNPGCVILDVGANHGMYTLELAGSAHATSIKRIVAIEPDPTLFELFSRSIDASGFRDRVIPINACLTDIHDGTADFLIYGETSSHNKMAPDGTDKGEVRTCRARTVSLDGLMADQVIETRQKLVMKIDIEGNEGIAFRGMEKSLREAAGYQVFFEFCPAFLEECGCPALSFAEYIIGMGNDLIVEIQENRHKTERIDSVDGFRKIIERCERATDEETRITNIFISKGLVVPESILGGIS